MSPATHFLLGWLTANTAVLNRRERTLVTLAGFVPDVDGAGLFIEQATKNTAYPLLWWSKYHHVLAHNLLFGLFLAVVTFLLSTKRWKTAVLALASFHIHIFCDIIGARGPDGHQWPIPYLVPFSDQPQLAWDGQWALNAWPNFLITIVALIASFYLAWKRGYSAAGIFSERADCAFVSTLRNRFSKASLDPSGARKNTS